MTATALLVGGSGPTGPEIVRGLVQRGYDVTLLHRGTHEVAELADLEHLHADPHFREPVDDAIGSRGFDLVVATYGRLRLVADALADRCAAFLAVSGLPAYAGYHEPARLRPRGIPVLATEDIADLGRADPDEESEGEQFSRKIRETERHVLSLQDSGAFAATVFRYPSIYGPRQLYPREWSVVRRVLDGRRRLIVPDAGLTISTRCAARNAAAHLLAAVDHPDAAVGQVFNVADHDQFTLAQWVRLAAAALGAELELVSIPLDLAGPGRALFPIPHTDHGLVSAQKAVDRLGYTEPVPAATAIAETVRWYADNPPDERARAALVDTFDYDEEERVIAAWERATRELAATQRPLDRVAHPYPHPKVAGRRDQRDR